MNRRTFLGLILAFVLIYGVTCFLSYAKFHVNDPVAVAGGLAQILWTDAEHVEIQEYPKVIIAKPESSLDRYMEKHKLYPDESLQMGAVHVFSNSGGDVREYVQFSANRYFAEWYWLQ